MNKILLCSPYEIGEDNNAGGIAIWTQNIMAEYRLRTERPIHVDLISTSRKIFISKDTSVFKRLFSGVREYSIIIKKIKQQIKQNNYDCLHLSSSGSVSLFKDYLILKFAAKRGIKTYIHFHFGRIPTIIKQKGWEYKMLMKVCNLTYKTIVMDSNSLVDLEREGIGNVVFLPNPVSADVAEALATKGDVTRQNNRILFVGHVSEKKGIFELIDACSQIKNIELIVIGKVELNVQNEIEARWPNAKWLHILGTMPHGQVVKEMLKCGIFVLPSYTEGFPNVILEAMACSCPIISTSVGAIPEMLAAQEKNKCGIVIPPKNINALKSALDNLLADNGLAKKLSYNAILKVNSEYSSQKIFNRLCEIWSK